MKIFADIRRKDLRGGLQKEREKMQREYLLQEYKKGEGKRGLREKEEKCFYRRGERKESGKRASSPLPRFR
jgi:hypothetical protein